MDSRVRTVRCRRCQRPAYFPLNWPWEDIRSVLRKLGWHEGLPRRWWCHECAALALEVAHG